MIAALHTKKENTYFVRFWSDPSGVLPTSLFDRKSCSCDPLRYVLCKIPPSALRQNCLSPSVGAVLFLPLSNQHNVQLLHSLVDWNVVCTKAKYHTSYKIVELPSWFRIDTE